MGCIYAILQILALHATIASPLFFPLFPRRPELTGNVCQEAYPYTYEARRTRTEKYVIRTSGLCGKVLKLFWCTKYRTETREVTYYEPVKETRYRQVCCDGWSLDSTGTNCGIHDQAPVREYCPSTQRRTSSSASTRVYWSPPRFREPHAYGLTIGASHNPGDVFGIGTTTVRYTATSQNNNRESACAFDVIVTPPIDKPRIQQLYLYGEEGVPMTVICRADHGVKPFDLTWTIQLKNENVQKNFGHSTLNLKPSFETRIEDGLPGYKNAISKLTFTPNKEVDEARIRCQGYKYNLWRFSWRFEVDMVYLYVHYDPEVEMTCPMSQNLTTDKRETEVDFMIPTISNTEDMMYDNITIKCNREGKQILRHGFYDVTCSAKNEKTSKSARCQYRLSIVAKACPELSPPINGAVLCGHFTKQQVVVCQMLCQHDYDVCSYSKVPEVTTCSLRGTWIPNMNKIIACTKARTEFDNMPSRLHYLPSEQTCGSEILPITKERFTTTIRGSFLGDHVCITEDCTADDYTMYCPVE